MTHPGSLSVRGNVLPVGGVTAKVEAAIETGLKKVIVPESNMGDIILDESHKDKIEIIPVSTIMEVLQYALESTPERKTFFDKVSDILNPNKVGSSKISGRQGPNAV